MSFRSEDAPKSRGELARDAIVATEEARMPLPASGIGPMLWAQAAFFGRQRRTSLYLRHIDLPAYVHFASWAS